jgi:hypothetical protein
MEAPRAKVHFTTCLYDSPVQTMPSWDQTDVGVGIVDELTDMSEGLSSPITQFVNPPGDVR